MPKSDFIPRSDADLLVWHDQLKAAATSIGATLGITAADLTALGDDNTELRTNINAASAATAAAQQATREKVTSRRAAEQNARKFARRLKEHANYTPALGEQLRIEGPEDTTDMSTARPKLTGIAKPHAVVELTFNKLKSDGVNIYSQREGDAAFVFLARDTATPYVDNRACLVAGKPETRKYKAIFVIDDAEIGQFSDEVVVTCQP
ncbi:MAG: hypothetical protein HYY24_17095 [Verrucomicrobia bacterium]|nr:hypothetical protein [Verrucomicrobiota bacterium]